MCLNSCHRFVATSQHILISSDYHLRLGQTRAVSFIMYHMSRIIHHPTPILYHWSSHTHHASPLVYHPAFIIYYPASIIYQIMYHSPPHAHHASWCVLQAAMSYQRQCRCYQWSIHNHRLSLSCRTIVVQWYCCIDLRGTCIIYSHVIFGSSRGSVGQAV